MSGTAGILRYDKYLSNLSIAQPTGNYISQIVSPIVRSGKSSDKIHLRGRDNIRLTNDEAEGVASNSVDRSVGTPYSFKSTRKALSDTILDKDANNTDEVIMLRQETVEDLTSQLMVRHEKRVADILTDNSKVTAVDIDATATRLDETDPTFETDLVTAVSTIKSASGVIPNTIVLPFDVALYMANIQFVKDSLNPNHGIQRLQGTIPGQPNEVIGLPAFIKGLKVIVADGDINDANKGEADNITTAWGKNILIGHVPARPNRKSMAGVLTLEYAPRMVKKKRVDDPDGEKIVVEWDYDIPEMFLGCWYLMENVIA